MKRCCRCKRLRRRTSFSKNRRRADGLQSTCKDCAKVDHRNYYRSNKAAQRERDRNYRTRILHWFFEQLVGRACVDCGESDPVTLDFDHRGNKTECVSVMVFSGFGQERIAAEIAKCDVRCANCHRRKTHGRTRRATWFKNNKGS